LVKLQVRLRRISGTSASSRHFATHSRHPGTESGGPSRPKVWFVDLYRKDHTPYDPKEIETIRKHITSSKAPKQ